MSSSVTWVPLQLESPALPPFGGEVSGTVAIVASPGVGGEWASRAAAALARAWAVGGREVVLVDVGLEEPELHRALGVENAEGVSDMLLFGASLRRIARAVDGIHLVTAGTVAADPSSLRASPRWDALVDAFQEAGGSLVLYVPAGVPCADAMLARADHVIGLRREGETDEVLELGEAAARLRGVVGPGAEPEPGAGERGDVGEHGTAGADGEDEADLSAGAVPGDASPAPHPARSPERRAPEGTRAGGGFRLFLIFLALLALVLVLAASMGWIRVPGLAGAESGSALAAQEVATTDREIREPLAGWALALESFLDAEVAMRRAREFQERYVDELFWVVPVRVDGRRFYRVLAGQRSSEAELEGLRASLGGGASWYARRVELAFLLGELPDLDAAQTLTDVLAGLGIPTHVLRVRDARGAWSYRVFAGGYASEDEARELAEMLREHDLAVARLVERRGVAPE